MKTAEEWAKDMGRFNGNDCENVSMKDRVAAIQLDAERSGYERGVREAAGIVSSYHHAITTPQTRALFHKTIITALLANPKEPNAKI